MSTKEGKQLAVVYSRFSPRPDAAESESIPAQEAACRNYAIVSGWHIEAYFQDAAMSGATREGRKGLEAMMKHLEEKGGNRVVLCYSMSRISRSVIDLLNLMEELTELKCEFAAVRERIDTTTPTGRFTTTLFAALNQLEREQIAQRTSDAMGTMVMRGRSPGTVPHGYRVLRTEIMPSGKRKTWIQLNPNTLPAYKRLFELRHHGSYKQCARWLNMEGLIVNDTPWTRDSVRRALEAIDRYNLIEQLERAVEQQAMADRKEPAGV
jgi:DNA invertase Pin-like site-specific DNA recombinase